MTKEHAKRSASVMIGTLAYLLFLSSCAKREITQSNNSYPPVITMTDELIVKLSNHLFSRDELLQKVPSSVDVQPSVVRAEAGRSYVFTLNWTFVGTAPTYWQVMQYRFSGEGAEEVVFDRIRTTGNDILSIVSELSGGQRYKFEFAAHVTEPYGEYGDVVFKTITVDLRGLR